MTKKTKSKKLSDCEEKAIVTLEARRIREKEAKQRKREKRKAEDEGIAGTKRVAIGGQVLPYQTGFTQPPSTPFEYTTQTPSRSILDYIDREVLRPAAAQAPSALQAYLFMNTGQHQERRQLVRNQAVQVGGNEAGGRQWRRDLRAAQMQPVLQDILAGGGRLRAPAVPQVRGPPGPPRPPRPGMVDRFVAGARRAGGVGARLGGGIGRGLLGAARGIGGGLQWVGNAAVDAFRARRGPPAAIELDQQPLINNDNNVNNNANVNNANNNVRNEENEEKQAEQPRNERNQRAPEPIRMGPTNAALQAMMEATQALNARGNRRGMGDRRNEAAFKVQQEVLADPSVGRRLYNMHVSEERFSRPLAGYPQQLMLNYGHPDYVVNPDGMIVDNYVGKFLHPDYQQLDNFEVPQGYEHFDQAQYLDAVGLANIRLAAGGGEDGPEPVEMGNRNVPGQNEEAPRRRIVPRRE